MTEEAPNAAAQVAPAPASAASMADIDRHHSATTPSAENPRARGHSPARDTREQMEHTAADGSAIHRFGEVEFTETELRDLMRYKGERDVRKLSLPKSPDEYQVKVPENFKAPGDVKFEFNKDDPVIKQARQLAHAREMDQGTFEDFLGIYAAHRISEAIQINNARQAEVAKLGSMAPQRIDAIRTWLHATLGSELAGAIEMSGLCTAKQVEAFERMIDRFSRQGGTLFTQGGRVPEEPAGKIAGYENMSFAQKRAAQMNQQFGGGSRGNGHR